MMVRFDTSASSDDTPHNHQNINTTDGLKSRTESYFENFVTVVDENISSQIISQFASRIVSNKRALLDTEPFYIMEVGKITRMINYWCRLLPRVQPFFSVSCNCDPFLLRVLSNKNFGFNCTTCEDLRIVSKFYHGKEVLCSNPCLTSLTISRAASAEIDLIVFQSEKDLYRIIGSHQNPQLILNICLNTDSEDPTAHFGCRKEEATQLIETAALAGATIVGIGFDAGNDCLCPETYKIALKFCSRLFEFAQELFPEIRILKIAGGFSNLSFDENSVECELFRQINESLDDHFAIHKYPNIRIIATTGQFIVGSAYSLITCIIDRRQIDASTITKNDYDVGSRAYLYQINEGYYSSFGSKLLENCNPLCVPLDDDKTINSDEEFVYGAVLGPYGYEENSFDVIQRCMKFRPLCVGDWLCWSNMGAYTMKNYGSLEEAEDSWPRIFYLSTRKDWEQLGSNYLESNKLESNKFSDEEISSMRGRGDACYIENDDDDMLSLLWSN